MPPAKFRGVGSAVKMPLALHSGQGFFRMIKTQGGGGGSPKTPCPPPQTKGTIVGKNEIYTRENLVRPFLVHQVWIQNPLPPSPPLLKRSPDSGGP